jgi:hypothetical protein
MYRRTFLQGAAALATSSLAKPSKVFAAQTALGMAGPMGVPSRAWVEHPKIIKQHCDQWCWAASISMIFATLGHPMDQEQIVDRIFSGRVCRPAGTGKTMSEALGDTWTDTHGVEFTANIDANYDQLAGIDNTSNAIIVDELSNDRPVLYANKHHAMVVVAVEYFETPMGPNVRAVGVLDPWPYNPDFHPLSQNEMIAAYRGGDMTYLGAVSI